MTVLYENFMFFNLSPGAKPAHHYTIGVLNGHGPAEMPEIITPNFTFSISESTAPMPTAQTQYTLEPEAHFKGTGSGKGRFP